MREAAPNGLPTVLRFNEGMWPSSPARPFSKGSGKGRRGISEAGAFTDALGGQYIGAHHTAPTRSLYDHTWQIAHSLLKCGYSSYVSMVAGSSRAVPSR